MKQYSCILFDLDGTLANTFPGILHSYEYVAKHMGLESPSEKIVNEVIGAPLLEVFRERFGLDELMAIEAVRKYREYYEKYGLFEVDSYPEMENVLKKLKEKGKVVGVATLKNEIFAKKMLTNMGLGKYIDMIVGMDGKDKLTKALIIKKALKRLKQKEKNAVLVGDSFYDSLGAKEAGVDFIGVTYGFGFKKKEDIFMYDNVGAVDKPVELLEREL